MLIAFLAALPWILVPIVYWVRVRDSRSLDEYAAAAPPDAPLVSVVVPARNEAHNIERCVRSILATTYPRMELIVVDDNSADGTGDIAQRISATDPRVTVLKAPALQPDWFGKQWACATGAARARGEILLFTDADTTHSADLLSRSVNAIRGRRADLLSVYGHQELGTFWEKLIQPQIFAMLELWYGGTETVTRSRRAWKKIANGQCLFMTRAAYDSIGGHAAVRHTVAEDLMLAQTTFRNGGHVVFIQGRDQLSTRMYTSLREMIEGWGKNVFAGGMHAMPGGAKLRALYTPLFVTPPLFGLVPAIVLLLSLILSMTAGMTRWAAIATAATVVGTGTIYARVGAPPAYGLVYPLGSAITFYIFARAILRGTRVTWKGRSYRAA